MDIFEQMESCHVIEVNGNITDNFSIDFESDEDDNLDGWLTVNIKTEDGDVERWYGYNELSKATEHGDGFMVGADNDVLEFHVLCGVQHYSNLCNSM